MQFLKQILIVTCVGTENRYVLISTRIIYLLKDHVFLAAERTRREAPVSIPSTTSVLCAGARKTISIIYRYPPTVIEVFTVHSTRFASQAVHFFHRNHDLLGKIVIIIMRRVETVISCSQSTTSVYGKRLITAKITTVHHARITDSTTTTRKKEKCSVLDTNFLSFIKIWKSAFTQ